MPLCRPVTASPRSSPARQRILRVGAIGTPGLLHWLVIGAVISAARAQEVKDGQFPVVSNLKAGVAKVDITPPDAAAVGFPGMCRRSPACAIHCTRRY